MPWYSFKAQTRQYLEEINKDPKVLEYCLFQPGLFTNYLTHPYRSTTHVADIETPFDFGNRRMIVCRGGGDHKITFTTVRDLANVVALAVEYDGEWPVVGGMKGSDLSVGQLLALGEELRGKSTLRVM
jgi:nucleoside-diphosphate-sugar epimerase